MARHWRHLHARPSVRPSDRVCVGKSLVTRQQENDDDEVIAKSVVIRLCSLLPPCECKKEKKKTLDSIWQTYFSYSLVPCVKHSSFPIQQTHLLLIPRINVVIVEKPSQWMHNKLHFISSQWALSMAKSKSSCLQTCQFSVLFFFFKETKQQQPRTGIWCGKKGMNRWQYDHTQMDCALQDSNCVWQHKSGLSQNVHKNWFTLRNPSKQ